MMFPVCFEVSFIIKLKVILADFHSMLFLAAI